MILWSESLKKKIQESLDSPKKCIFDLLSQDIDTEEELGLRKEIGRQYGSSCGSYLKACEVVPMRKLIPTKTMTYLASVIVCNSGQLHPLQCLDLELPMLPGN